MSEVTASRWDAASDATLPADIRAAGAGRVDKPWGYELIWAVTDRYVGKLIHVRSGHALSLMKCFHRGRRQPDIHFLM